MRNELVSKKAIRQVLKDYWQEYKAHPWQVFLSFIPPAVGNILIFFVPPLIIGKLINMFAVTGRVSLGSAGLYIAMFGGLWFLGEVLWRLTFHFLGRLEMAGMEKLSRRAFTRLLDRNYDFYTDHFVGSLTKKAMAFSRNFESFTDTLVFNVVSAFFPVVFVVFVLWTYSPLIPLVLLCCVAIALGVAIPIIRRRAPLVALRHEASSKLTGRLSDALTNILTIKSFATEPAEYRAYETHIDDYSGKWIKAADAWNFNFAVPLSVIYVVTNVIGLILALFFGEKLALPAGTVVVVFSYYAQVTRIFWETSRIYRNIEASLSEAGEFTEMFFVPSAVADHPGADTLSVPEARISFENVSFRYHVDEAEENSFLNNFDLVIGSREKVGLVGPSGGGKTTITKLLLRFIDVEKGGISIDGMDIRQVTQASLREHIAYVPQEPPLFHRTLFENIAYGKESATEAEVIEAARLAHAHEFISQLPLGYRTLVGERGIKLSGGQRQRVAIARAILKNAPILILDEATSSLDSESEKYIQEGLWELMKDKTALVIAHRLSTIKHLDRIIVLDGGKIVEDGTHEELLKNKGLYARLWSHQSGEFL